MSDNFDFEDGFSFGEEEFTEPVGGGMQDTQQNGGGMQSKQQRPVKPVQKKQESQALPNPNQVVKQPKPKKEGQYSQHVREVNQPRFTDSATPVPNVQEGTVLSKKKGKGKLVILAVTVLIVVGGVLAFKLIGGGMGSKEAKEYDYDKSGKYYYDQLQEAVRGYNPEVIDTLVGVSQGDSYIAQELSYANKNEVRENFIKKVTGMMSFKYPQVQQLSVDNKVMKDKSGNPIMTESMMNNGEKVIVIVPDYTALASNISSSKDEISTLLLKSGIEKSDYDYQDKCFDLFCSYFLGLSNIPVTEVEIQLNIQGGIFVDDIELDKVLFSSDAYHSMLNEFDKILTGYTGYKTEKYFEKEEVHNPEFDAWYKVFKERYDADGGKFDKYTSMWEPWYIYDENNVIQVDETGQPLVKYYSVKDDNGNDWIQPPETVMADVEKTREVEVAYVAEQAVPHCYLGAYFARNEYVGTANASVRVGTGSVDEPAGIGTPIITKVLCNDGKYHDIRITMKGYWVGEDAINYAVTFSEKNRGFDPRSPVQLICYELEVENLEKVDITFDSEMMLCDKSASRTGRTGTMYGFSYEGVTCKAGSKVVFNDWATSTEIQQKYAAWGKSFNRKVEPVFFDVLAGRGEVPKYSAYKQFTGNSSISDDANTPVTYEDTTESKEETEQTS